MNLSNDYVEGEQIEYLAERVADVQKKMKEIRVSARERSDEVKRRAKLRYDKNVHAQRFEVGEEVLLLKMVTDSKFGDKWEGPYTILSVNEASGTYYLTGKNSQRFKHPVNGDRLKKFSKNTTARLIPEVSSGQRKVEENFQTWLEDRVRKSINVVETDSWLGESNACGAVRDKCLESLCSHSINGVHLGKSTDFGEVNDEDIGNSQVDIMEEDGSFNFLDYLCDDQI